MTASYRLRRCSATKRRAIFLLARMRFRKLTINADFAFRPYQLFQSHSYGNEFSRIVFPANASFNSGMAESPVQYTSREIPKPASSRRKTRHIPPTPPPLAGVPIHAKRHATLPPAVPFTSVIINQPRKRDWKKNHSISAGRNSASTAIRVWWSNCSSSEYR